MTAAAPCEQVGTYNGMVPWSQAAIETATLMILYSRLPGCGKRSAIVCCSTLKLCAFVVQNRGAEGAMEWVLSHMEDANFNDPLSEPSQASTTGAAEAPPTAADPEAVMMLVSMGFTDQQAAAALKVSAHALILCCLMS